MVGVLHQGREQHQLVSSCVGEPGASLSALLWRDGQQSCLNRALTVKASCSLEQSPIRPMREARHSHEAQLQDRNLWLCWPYPIGCQEQHADRMSIGLETTRRQWPCPT